LLAATRVPRALSEIMLARFSTASLRVGNEKRRWSRTMTGVPSAFKTGAPSLPVFTFKPTSTTNLYRTTPDGKVIFLIGSLDRGTTSPL
jgi:hypothetical protein